MSRRLSERYGSTKVGENNVFGKVTAVVRRQSLFHPEHEIKSLDLQCQSLHWNEFTKQEPSFASPYEYLHRLQLEQASFVTLHQLLKPMQYAQEYLNDNQAEEIADINCESEEMKEEITQLTGLNTNEKSSEIFLHTLSSVNTRKQSSTMELRKNDRERSNASTMDYDISDFNDTEQNFTLPSKYHEVIQSHKFNGNADNESSEEEISNNLCNIDEELNFEGRHLHESVRKLMEIIELDSEHTSSHHASSGQSRSNQDELDENLDGPEASRFSQIHQKQSGTSSDLVYPEDCDSIAEQKDDCETDGEGDSIESGSNKSLHRFVLDEVTDPLSTSVRRLVLNLKDDFDRHQVDRMEGSASISKKKLMQLPFSRRRGNSCPSPYPNRIGGGHMVATSQTRSSEPYNLIHPLTAGGGRRSSKILYKLAPKRLFDTLAFRRKVSETRGTYLYTDEELESVEGARWKIVELAYRFGGKHRFYLVQAVNMFFPLWKYGRRGGAHSTRLHCNRCGTLQWQHKRGGLSDSIDLADVLQVIDGRKTEVFRKYHSSPVLEVCSFSLVLPSRTLDLETSNISHRDWLMSALRTLVAYARKQRTAENQAIAERSIMTIGSQTDNYYL